MEVVPFTLTLAAGTNRISAWALDERGQRKAALPVTGTSTKATITVSAGAGSIWYELQVAPFLVGFEPLALNEFQRDGANQPAISGEGAAAAGDGVPNLAKYYLGLPAKTTAPSNRLPQGRLLTVSNLLYLALIYERDKAALDVNAFAEVSPDLAGWLSGPSYTETSAVTNLGVRERTPARAAPARFMRLRLQRQIP